VGCRAEKRQPTLIFWVRPRQVIPPPGDATTRVGLGLARTCTRPCLPRPIPRTRDQRAALQKQGSVRRSGLVRELLRARVTAQQRADGERWQEAEMILTRPCMNANGVHKLVKNELRPRRLARPKLHRITLLRPVGTGGSGESGMAEAILVALFSLLVRATAAVTAASCACSTAPREWRCKRALPKSSRRNQPFQDLAGRG